MDQFIGEIRRFVSETLPDDWLPCDGRLLQIKDNVPLFSLIGGRYGGNGTDTFALPDLRGAFPVHAHDGGIGMGESANSAGAPAATVAIMYAIAVKGMYPVQR